MTPDPTPPDRRTALLESARRVYAALADRDGPTLVGLLHPDLVARMTDGLPFGIGGTHQGATAMVTQVWRPTLEHFDLRPVAAQLLPVDGEDCVVVLGRYQGTARATGRRVDAAFVHVLRLDGAQVTEWTQVTDSAAWLAALAG